MARLFTLQHETTVHAPIERCFLLSTSLAIVQRELHMRPVRGRTSGLVVNGDTVRWQGWHLGLPQYHESLIEDFQAPFFFRDRMIAGRFATFEHDHAFFQQPSGAVLLHDELRFTMPLGWAGALVGQWILSPDIHALMRRRFALIRKIAESDEWKQYLPATTP
ncbi:SRPBCC family protein [Acidicapsa ligni]|uniref:SRPBCC family protein n=1 Tax=Acidicapsa ligni TaxID=542300 RepID=UPI0021DFEC46|nr:hypothetical protein [Acidicapsa ligni]